MLGAIIGASIGAAGGGINGALQGWQNLYNSKKLAKYNYKLQKRGLEEFPTSQRIGLEAAGYNPMLALGSIGSHTYGGGIPSGGAGMGDIVGGARQGAKLAHDIKERFKAETDNINADTALKDAQKTEAETRRLQNEASTSLIHSQTDRADLAYGRDILDSAVGVAGVGAHYYSAKSMSDLAKSKVQNKNGKPNVKPAARINAGRPAVQGSVNSKPTAGGSVGSSAKGAGKVVKELMEYLGPAALIGAGLGTLEGKNKERDIKRGDHWDPKDKNNRKEKARKKWYLYHDIGF